MIPRMIEKMSTAIIITKIIIVLWSITGLMMILIIQHYHCYFYDYDRNNNDENNNQGNIIVVMVLIIKTKILTMKSTKNKFSIHSNKNA